MKSTILDDVASDLAKPADVGTRIFHATSTTPLCKERFIPIQSEIPLYSEENSQDILFADSGNAPIWETPSQTAHLCRVCALSYTGPTRRALRRQSFCILSTLYPNQIVLKSYGFDIGLLPISRTDPELRHGNHLVSALACIELGRLQAELWVAREEALRLEPGAMLIVEGDFSKVHPFIFSSLESVIKTCAERGITLLGISKTNTCHTDTGCSAGYALHLQGQPGMWAYALNSTDGMHRVFAKLHPGARHIFLVSSPTPLKDGTLARIAKASTDPAFLGYPYGLIAADQLARVSATEQQAAQAILSTKAFAKNPTLPLSLRGSDAHMILDRMGY